MYSSVIGQRYKAPIISAIWSYEEKVKTMRLLWIALAENQKQLGVSCITQEGIDIMKQQVENINLNLFQKFVGINILYFIFHFLCKQVLTMWY